MSKERKYYHEVVGFNYRMTNLQAAIGTAQIERIDEILNWRTNLEEQYKEAFNEIEGVTVQRNDLPGRKKIAWLVSILVEEKKRNVILRKLKDSGIDARPFFIPFSEMKLYQKYAQKCQNSKKISQRGINLPTTCEMNRERVGKIVSLINSVI